MQRTHRTNPCYELNLEIEHTFNRLRWEQRVRERMEHKWARVENQGNNGQNGGNDDNFIDLQ